MDGGGGGGGAWLSYSVWGRKESDTSERLHLTLQLYANSSILWSFHTRAQGHRCTVWVQPQTWHPRNGVP